MPYFAVDDQITFHPKAVAAGNAAMGAWTRAGAWAKNHATGGFVSAEVAHAIGAKESKRLVTVGLWHVGEHPEFGQGYWFHDWDHVAGNADGETEKQRREAKREADRIRQRQKRESQKESRATPPRLSLPSVPVPSPQTDVTYLPGVTPDPAARESGISPELAQLIQEREFIRAEADKLALRDVPKARAALEAVVGPMPADDAYVIELVRAIVVLALNPVTNADAYIRTTCANSPDEVATQWATVQANSPIGAVA